MVDTFARYRAAAATAGGATATAGAYTLRYGLVVLIFWFGVFKFTATEAQAIEPLVRHSPLLSWLYAVTDAREAAVGSARRRSPSRS